MKATGRERDIEIAKLKGWKPYYAEGIFLDGIRVVDVRGTKQITDAKTISWSTDRNAVWELWDEIYDKTYSLPQHATKQYIYYADGIHEVKIYMKNNKIIHIKGKDFADCVSQAWITWMESNK
jgi:hypothetical protein